MLEVDPGSILAVRQSEFADGCGNSLNTGRSGKREKGGELGPKSGLGDGESTGFNGSVDSNGSCFLSIFVCPIRLISKKQRGPLTS